MRNFRRIICLYLTAAVILSAVIMGFGAENVALFNSAESVELPSDSLAESVLPSDSVSSDGAENTNTSELYTEKEEITEITAPETTVPEITVPETAVPETTVPETTVQETTIPGTTAPEASDEADEMITFEKILSAQPKLHNAYSPDNKNEKLTPLAFLSETVDSLAAADSINVYTFTVPKRAMFRYKFTHDVPQGAAGWEISLYCEYFLNGDGGAKDYRLVNTLKTTVLTVDSSPELGLAPGEYRLVVKKGNAFDGSTYKIEPELKETADYETECNDNIYRYTEIYSGVPVKGSASYFPDRQDDDYFLLRMYEDGFVDLKFEHATVKDKVSVCWQVLLFSEDGTCVFSVNSLFTDEINKSGKIGLSRGNYYVLIRNRVYADMTYTLTLSRTDNTDYENEKNDSPEAANLIGVGSTVTGTVASQINGIDRDYFRFNLVTNGFVVIDFAHEPIADSNDRNGWNIVLLDENKNVIYKGISAWADDVTVSASIGLGKGTYYVRIDSENLHLNSDKYYLTVNFTEDAARETEYNNTFDTADAVTEHIPVVGVICENKTDYDTDYYVIDIAEKTDVKIEFFHEKAAGHKEIFNFTFYDSKKNAVKPYSENGSGSTVIKSFSDNEKIEAVYKSLEPGKYYVKVTSGIFFADVEYSLSFTKGE